MRSKGDVVRRSRARMIATGIAALVLVLVGGAAWAAGVHVVRSKGFQLAQTYTAVVPVNGGDSRVEWQVGRATFSVEFGGGQFDPNTGGYSWGINSVRVTNGGSGQIGVAWRTDGSFGDNTQLSDYGWVAPGEFFGDITGAGEVYNTGDSSPDPNAGWSAHVSPIAVFDEGGVTATGFYAWSFRYNEADQTGHYVFTLNLRG